MSASPYLTVKEAAAALGITEDGVRKLIRRGRLRAIKRSARRTIIPRPAFDAYIRKLNGTVRAPHGMAAFAGSLATRTAAFELQTGTSPAAWLAGWLAGETGVRDSSTDMGLAVAAVGLVAEQRSGAAAFPAAPVGPVAVEARA